MGGATKFLPGRIVIRRGGIEDYRRLAHFHYAPGHPATRAGVWVVTYRGGSEGRNEYCKMQIGNCKFSIEGVRGRRRRVSRVVAVAVLSYPTAALRARERALGLGGPRYGRKLAWANRNLRTISRVIVHPQFRGLGLAGRLVRRALRDAPVRYVEAVAAMGEVHPLFERAGMRRIEPAGEGEAAYFIFDRREARRKRARGRAARRKRARGRGTRRKGRRGRGERGRTNRETAPGRARAARGRPHRARRGDRPRHVVRRIASQKKARRASNRAAGRKLSSRTVLRRDLESGRVVRTRDPSVAKAPSG